jgi:hypothetical protein
MTQPEVLVRSYQVYYVNIEQFAYYFHCCSNLKYEDRPDYGTLKDLFWDLLTNSGLSMTTEYVFYWNKHENELEENNIQEEEKRNDNVMNVIDITPGYE